MNAPESAALDFDAARFLGTWYILVTNYGFWKHRHDPTVTYEPLPASGGRRTWRDTLRYRSRGLFGERPAELAGVDVELEPGRFIWRGDGLMSIVRSPWWVMLVDPAGDWAVTWFGRSNVGTAPGMDVYARRPDLPATTMDEILGKVRAHRFIGSRSSNLYATVQGALPVDRYRLG